MLVTSNVFNWEERQIVNHWQLWELTFNSTSTYNKPLNQLVKIKMSMEKKK